MLERQESFSIDFSTRPPPVLTTFPKKKVHWFYKWFCCITT